ncbi:PAS domain-containing protein [Deinococcus pimensis]|uniref:PAS domain-containing protein n=1 Tax=Deinococcus pimensis TaxID=309888 RepID=UPI0004B3CB9B|nr:PAS domain-containing protein [Deinococcus pimensis]
MMPDNSTDADADVAAALALYADSPDCVKVLDEHGHLLRMNPGGLRIMEIPDFTQCEGASWPDFWQDDTRPALLAALDTARAGGTGRFDGFCRTFAGTPRWWDVNVRALRGGGPGRFLAVSRDVTARVLAESVARGQAQVLEALTRGAPLGEVLEEITALVERLTGATRCVLLTLHDVATPGTPGAPATPAALHGAPHFFTPLLDERGDLHGTLEVSFGPPGVPAEEALDVARVGARLATLALQRDRQARALEASERRYRTLFEALPNVAWSSSEGGQVNAFNRHWSILTGLPTRPDGRSWIEAVHPDDREAALRARRACGTTRPTRRTSASAFVTARTAGTPATSCRSRRTRRPRSTPGSATPWTCTTASWRSGATSRCVTSPWRSARPPPVRRS